MLVAGIVASLTQVLPARLLERFEWLPWLGLAVAILAGLWLARSAWRSWRIRPPTRLSDAEVAVNAHIRGPRPFEDGEQLLGRDRETGSLLSLVRALEFRWGYVSGEAGAGKTSLLRAGLAARLREAQPDWRLIYLKRTGERPDREVVAQLAEALGRPVPGDDDFTAIAAAAAASGRPVTLVVIDQFEEFFLSARTAEARDRVVAGLRTLWDAGQASGRIRLLFSLRKEFVDDLISLEAAIPGLRFDETQRFSLANLAVDVAAQMIERIAGQGELPLSRQLRPRLAADLAVDGRVRPVELQIVLSRMQSRGIYELPAYAALGGAQGLISRFIAETIEPPDRKVAEIDRQVGRHVLRTLCADNFASRRPIGLSAAELESRIREQMALAAGGTSFAVEEIRAALLRVLDAFRRARVVIEEDEDRFNLAHDYLAAPVRDATADIETAEERANRLLQHYVAQSRVERGTVIPFRALRQVRLYASAEARERTDARALIRRSRRRLAVIAAAAAVLLLGLITWQLPFGWQLRVGAASPDRLVAVAVDGDSALLETGTGLRLVRLREPNAPPVPLPQQALDGVYTPALDRFVFALGPNVYLAERETGFRPSRVAREAVFSRDLIFQWMGFSADGRVGFVQLSDGRLYALPAGRPPVLVTADGLSGGLDPGDTGILGSRMPLIKLSPSGRHIVIADILGSIRVFRTDLHRGLPVAATSVPTGLARPAMSFSPDGRYVAWLGSGVVMAMPLAGNGPARPVILPRAGADLIKAVFAPRSDVLIAVGSNGSYMWRVGEAPRTRPVFSNPGTATDRDMLQRQIRPQLVFNDSGDAVIGLTLDGHAYVWQFSSPGTAGRPAVAEAPAGYDQVGIFCRAPGMALIVGKNGMLYRLRYAGESRVERVQFLSPSPRILRSRTDDRILILGESYVASGECGRGGLHVAQLDASVQRVVVGAGRRELLVDTLAGAMAVRRSLMLWGIPLLDGEWPSFEVTIDYVPDEGI